MNGSLLALGELVALAYLSFALVIAIACSGLYPLVRDRLLDWAPEDRAGWIFTACLAPAAGALLLTAICLLPSVAVLDWHLVDHCSIHGRGHPHLCLAHLPAGSGTIAGVAALAVMGILCTVAVVDFIRAVGLGRRLRATIEADGGSAGAEGSLPLAVTIGAFRPRIVISEALWRRLPGDLLAAIVLHERAHVRRRDPLLRMLARLGTLLHFPDTRRCLLHDLHVACEQACDEQAAAAVGDRLLVARALIAAERLLVTHRVPALPASASAFGGTTVAARVNALVEDPVSRSPIWLPAASIAVFALFVAAADRIHHSTETVLGLVTR